MEAHEPESFHWRYIDFDDHDFQIRGRTFLFAAVLFAILLLITFLFLYTRCRYRHLHHAAPHTSSSTHAPPSRPRGLDPSTIKSFPIVLHTSSSDTKSVAESECCICLGVFGVGEKVKVLPNCRHCFHSECVDKWLSSQPSCPLCRSSLRVDSPV
ncbi:RING-H2 finger protein ATL66 [Rhododendron vialii]|uniref:RING-H2 finger protein ATL66 n=1 Tax=Rhododendron vialii TaxID=182163 RepID=UPI00265D7E6F|nr:RING-H2 finger protein ATL66 [Rhododendron vialii]